jgi:hypothetical protein
MAGGTVAKFWFKKEVIQDEIVGFLDIFEPCLESLSFIWELFYKTIFSNSLENEDAILDRVFQSYGLDSAKTASIGSRTKEALLASLKRGSGPSSCLICISGIKKADPIW